VKYTDNAVQKVASAKSRYFSDLAKCLSYAELKVAGYLSDAAQSLKSDFSNCGEKVLFAPGEVIGAAATAKHWYNCVIKHLPNLGTNAINAFQENAVKFYPDLYQIMPIFMENPRDHYQRKV
jgi:hypothetical protein